MNNKPITYNLYEGTFKTLAPVAEQSVNILRFFDDENNQYNILVNRAELNEGQSVDEFCERQWQRMKNTVPGFELEGKDIKNEIGPAKLPVLQSANKYLQDGQWVKQVISFVTMPWHPQFNPHSRNLLVFTLATYTDFSEAQRKHYVRIINSFVPYEASQSVA